MRVTKEALAARVSSITTKETFLKTLDHFENMQWLIVNPNHYQFIGEEMYAMFLAYLLPIESD